MKKYKPQLAKAGKWKDIESWYRELVESDLRFEPMLDLVKYIMNNNLDERLYAFTSLHKLVVGLYEDIEWNCEALHIEFDISSRKWFFKYYSKPFQPLEFERKYVEELGIEKFDKVIQYLKW